METVDYIITYIIQEQGTLESELYKAGKLLIKSQVSNVLKGTVCEILVYTLGLATNNNIVLLQHTAVSISYTIELVPCQIR